MLAPFRPSAHDERILTELCDSLLQSSIELFNNRKQCRRQCHRHKRTRATNWTQNKEWQLSGLHVSWCVERLRTSSGAAGNAATRQHTTRRGHETLPRGRGQFGIRRSAVRHSSQAQPVWRRMATGHHATTHQQTNTRTPHRFSCVPVCRSVLSWMTRLRGGLVCGCTRLVVYLMETGGGEEGQRNGMADANQSPRERK